MRIAAHTKGGYGGVPESVGKEFESADEARDVKKAGAHKIGKGDKGDKAGNSAHKINKSPASLYTK